MNSTKRESEMQCTILQVQSQKKIHMVFTFVINLKQKTDGVYLRGVNFSGHFGTPHHKQREADSSVVFRGHLKNHLFSE